MTYARAVRLTSGFLPSIPALWGQARTMCQRLISEICKPAELASSRGLSRGDRRYVLAWLDPIERTVRHLLFAQALIHLLMTPEGKALRQQHAPPPPGWRTMRIPYPGWHTISRPPVKTPALQASTPPSTATPRLDLTVPATWPCSFGIEKVSSEPAKPVAKRVTPLALQQAVHLRAEAGQAAAQGKSHGSSLRIARRIEALRRVLERPRPHMLRLARWLASRRAETILLPPLSTAPGIAWRQGYDICQHARDHGLLGLRAYHRTLEAG